MVAMNSTKRVRIESTMYLDEIYLFVIIPNSEIRIGFTSTYFAQWENEGSMRIVELYKEIAFTSFRSKLLHWCE